MRTRVFSLITQGALGLVIIYAIVGGVYFTAYQEADEARTSAIESVLTQQQADIDQAQLQLAALLEANQAVADELKAEAAKRIAAEQESKAAQGKLAQLEQTVASSKTPSASEVIKEWRPRVAAVVCDWPVKGGKQTTKYGTAVLLPDSTRTTPQLLTSGHVIKYLNELPSLCTLDFPDQDKQIEISDENIMLSDSKYDWARINVPNPPVYATTLSLTAAPVCSKQASIGDSVIILGYPKIGSKNDITATEGIISGFEDNYYITSAKVERGNSGGAAILTKQNCYLGIPTFVDAGEIESLARILDQRVIQ